MSARPWYEELFGEDYLRIWARVLPEERTQRETQAIVDLLELPAGSRILDLCCGHGRHSVALAQRGYRVTGLDRSPLFLERARAAAEAAGVGVDWLRADMRAIPLAGPFDAVINIFTAFGYFDEAAEDLRVLEGVARVLRPGGRFLIETIHRDSLSRRYQPARIERMEDGSLVLEEHAFDFLAGRNRTRMTLVDPAGGRKEYAFSVRIYTLTELAALLAAAGLRVERCSGGLDGSELTHDSRRLAVLARR